MKFENIENSLELQTYLKNVLSRTGGKRKDSVYLYHYSNIEAVQSIVSTGYIWLGSIENMNDVFEKNVVQQYCDKPIYFASFSKSEENMGMYNMYSPGENGTILRLSYLDADRILNKYKENKNEKKCLHIVKNNKITDKLIAANLFWAEVSYKKLRNNTIIAGGVSNSRIQNTIKNKDLIGFIKLYGWEYEKEVRLFTILDRKLS